MKSFFYLFLILGLTSCKSAKLENNPPFNVSGATYNYWVGGRPGVSGIKIIINYVSNEEVSFDKIYFQNMEGGLESYTKDDKTYLIGRINTGKKDRAAVVMNIDPKKEANNKPPSTGKIPYELEQNEAMLVYTYKGKKLTYKVSGIKKTKTDFYP